MKPACMAYSPSKPDIFRSSFPTSYIENKFLITICQQLFLRISFISPPRRRYSGKVRFHKRKGN